MHQADCLGPVLGVNLGFSLTPGQILLASLSSHSQHTVTHFSRCPWSVQHLPCEGTTSYPHPLPHISNTAVKVMIPFFHQKLKANHDIHCPKSLW
jgi:hypothetical protein